MKRERGQYFTKGNPFSHPLFLGWLSLLPPGKVLEPFAGACDIPRLVGGDLTWDCYDIDPKAPNVIRQDTLASFPTGYSAAITNPPYLAKNSATRRGMKVDMGRFDDLYKHALDLMLKNCQYVAAIIPNSFLTSLEFRFRIHGVISLAQDMFEDTDHPVCLALFSPRGTGDFLVYRNEDLLGYYRHLENVRDELLGSKSNGWRFNDPGGAIGIMALDNTKGKSISFVEGEKIDPASVKSSSRSNTRVSGPLVPGLIEEANRVLARYRQETGDIFLSSFMGMREDGDYRRRLDWSTARKILDLAHENLTTN